MRVAIVLPAHVVAARPEDVPLPFAAGSAAPGADVAVQAHFEPGADVAR